MMTNCEHHWVLGQPRGGTIEATCGKCSGTRVYPAVLYDLDPGVDTPAPTGGPETRHPSGVATAVGGARPSSVATLVVEVEEGSL
jgi:hypothetical protein